MWPESTWSEATGFRVFLGCKVQEIAWTIREPRPRAGPTPLLRGLGQAGAGGIHFDRNHCAQKCFSSTGEAAADEERARVDRWLFESVRLSSRCPLRILLLEREGKSSSRRPARADIAGANSGGQIVCDCHKPKNELDNRVHIGEYPLRLFVSRSFFCVEE